MDRDRGVKIFEDNCAFLCDCLGRLLLLHIHAPGEVPAGIFCIGGGGLKIGFVGGGRVGKAYGRFLKNSGYEVLGYYSRTSASAESAADFAGTRWYGTLEELAAEADMLFLTVNDDQICAVSKSLADSGMLRAGTVVVHMSGALGSDILRDVRDRGCHAYSLHPLLSFAEPEKAVLRIRETVFSLEGDPEKMEVMVRLLEETGCRHFRIETEKKALYHAAACVASNYVTVLLDYAFSLYEELGLTRKEASEALMPLVEGTVQNAREGGPHKTLTGPISRGDGGVIRRHMEAFGKLPEDKEVFYRFMGLQTVAFARRYGLQSDEKMDEIEKILNRGEMNG